MSSLLLNPSYKIGQILKEQGYRRRTQYGSWGNVSGKVVTVGRSSLIIEEGGDKTEVSFFGLNENNIYKHL